MAKSDKELAVELAAAVITAKYTGKSGMATLTNKEVESILQDCFAAVSSLSAATRASITASSSLDDK